MKSMSTNYSKHLDECKISKEAWDFLERKYDNFLFSIDKD